MRGEGINDVAFMPRRCIIDGKGCLFLEGLPRLEWERIWAPMEFRADEIEAGRAVTVGDGLLTSSRLVSSLLRVSPVRRAFARTGRRASMAALPTAVRREAPHDNANPT